MELSTLSDEKDHPTSLGFISASMVLDTSKLTGYRPVGSFNLGASEHANGSSVVSDSIKELKKRLEKAAKALVPREDVGSVRVLDVRLEASSFGKEMLLLVLYGTAVLT